MDSEQIWEKSQCWTCLIELEINKDNQWECPKCKDIYYLCYGCNQKGEKSWDWFDNNKGLECIRCENHFCIFCWQNSGKLVTFDSESNSGDEYSDGDYICKECQIDS